MSSIISLLPAEGWPRLIIDALWQTTLIAAVGSIAARFLVRQPAARAWLLLLTLTACLIVPLASVAARSAGWTLISRAPTTADAIPIRAENHRLATRFDLPPTKMNAAPAQGVVAEPAFVVSRTGMNGLSMTAMVWLAASTLLFARLTLSLLAVWRLVRQAMPCTDASLLAAASQASRHVGLARPPRLLVSNAVATPMVLALGRPTILLPAAQSVAAGAIDWGAVFTHELAHVVRGDGWSQLWVQLITMALPLQPLVWVARRAFYTACEEACDDWAVESGSDPVDLASTLLAWIHCPASPGLLVGIGMSSTQARIRRLLTLRSKPMARLGAPWRWASIPAATLLVAGLAVAQTTANGKQPSETTLTITPSGNSTQEQPQSTLPDKNEKQPPDKITISGTCVDENKKPLANARVRLFFIDYYFVNMSQMSQRQIGDVAVDGNGRFRLSDVDLRRVRDRHAFLKVVAQSPGKATAIRHFHEQDRGQACDFTLSPSATMQGQITDAEGRPVAGAIVSTGLLTEPVIGIGAAATDAAGNYEISDLWPFDLADQKPQPAGHGMFTMLGNARAHIHHADYARQPFEYSKVPSVVDATVHRVAVVEGQIVLGDNGQPAVGVQVEFSNDLVGVDYWTRTYADDHGRYKLATLPPGKYRLSAKLKGRPNLFRLDVPLHAGENTLDLRMEKGATVKGRFIDVDTGKSPELAKGESMQISTREANGRSYGGMNHANIQPDGTFTFLVPSGRNYFSYYIGHKWSLVDNDDSLQKGVDVAEGQTLELEIRVKPKTQPPM